MTFKCSSAVQLFDSLAKEEHHSFSSRGNDPCLSSFLQFARRGGSVSFRSSSTTEKRQRHDIHRRGFLAIIAFAVAATLVIFAIGPIMVLNPRRRGEAFYEARGEPLSPADLQLSFEEFWFVNGDHSVFTPGSSRRKSPCMGQSFTCTASGTTRSADCGWRKFFILGIST